MKKKIKIIRNQFAKDLEDRIDRYKKHCESLTAEISTKNNRIKELEKGLSKWKAQCLELKYPCEEKESEE